MDLIEEYALNSEKPTFLAIRAKTTRLAYTWAMHVKTVKAGSPVDIELDLSWSIPFILSVAF